MPSFMNRSCQTQVFDLPVRRMISLVPTPSALERMIAARQACFCEALRSLVIASSRPRTDRVIVDGNSGAHAPDSHGYRNRGIPISQRATPAGRIIMLTRRNFGTALVAGAALATSAQQARPQPASKRTIVDAQVHFWKANSPDWAWDPGARPQLPEPFSRFDRRSASRLATHLCELRCRWRARAADNRPVAWARSGSHHRAIRTSGQ
jgi:hypothetical protein